MTRRNRPPSRDEAADRISAYVYGNILVLSSLIVLYNKDVRSGAGLAIVLGTAVSTFAAHAYSEWLGSAVREGGHASLPVVLRDSLPIMSAASGPAVFMAVGAFEWLPAKVCLELAEAWVIARIAATGFALGRLQGRPVTAITWIASLALAAVAFAIVGLKLALAH
ncbi:hypothetical protein ASE12_17420 [Aeromicrobium sp. Root236]|uniref:hypothetical protein n=1 Tax=Aeromicrobium sp. Root236 TaxID=1736498 RepID=UPI0006FFF922|nr:hypothetical protein [Aeromicrobium sp. Root236]KRC66383.1 hypothetical protein ASE12_17420 [Aeromicrobium sp. Root236]